MTLTQTERDLIQSMCRNDLSVSATAKDLNYHRNSILYQIRQLHEKTGIDCRTFYGAARLLLLSKREE